MNNQTQTVFFSLIRSAVSDVKLNEKEKELFKPEMLQTMLALSKKHDIAHLLVYGLKCNGLLTQELSGLEKYIHLAIYRSEVLNYEYERTCFALEAAGIPFMPLKGAVIKNYYPEAWMRTSGDIDILVKEKDLRNAMDVLCDKCGYTYQKKSTHEIVFASANKSVIELHFSLIEAGRINKSTEVLDTVWSTASVCEGCSYRYRMSDDMFYFYHIAHMAKHIKNGGCGIKPVIDIYLLNGTKKNKDFKQGDLLKQGDLVKFTQAFEKLSQVWFENAEKDAVSECLEEYILRGGVYGTINNSMKIKATNGVSKSKSFFSLVFLSRKNLEVIYPNLKKYPMLFPFYQVKRWFRVFKKEKRNRVKELTNIRNSISKEELNSTAALLDYLGL